MMLKVSVDGFEFFSSACNHVDINRLADGSKRVSCTLEMNGQTISFYSSADMMKIYHLRVSSEFGVLEDGSFVCTEVSCVSDKGIVVSFVPYGSCRPAKRVFHD